jgi:hypothetical protein
MRPTTTRRDLHVEPPHRPAYRWEDDEPRDRSSSWLGHLICWTLWFWGGVVVGRMMS